MGVEYENREWKKRGIYSRNEEKKQQNKNKCEAAPFSKSFNSFKMWIPASFCCTNNFRVKIGQLRLYFVCVCECFKIVAIESVYST